MTKTALDIRDSKEVQEDYPLVHSEAVRLINDGLARVKESKGWSQRDVAKVLNYKTSVVLSHMALGRVPIPIDRALDFSRVLGIDGGKMIMAVLEQRHPDIDFARHLAGMTKRKPEERKPDTSYVLEELENLAGTSLDEMPNATIDVLRDAVADRNAGRRWIKINEVPIIEALRRHHPDGLTPAQRKKLDDVIAEL